MAISIVVAGMDAGLPNAICSTRANARIGDPHLR